MTTAEAVIVITAIPVLLVIGVALAPIILGAVAIVIGVIVFLCSVAFMPVAWCICKYNKWRYRRQCKRDWDELQKWAKDNPDALQWARDNPGK